MNRWILGFSLLGIGFSACVKVDKVREEQVKHGENKKGKEAGSEPVFDGDIKDASYDGATNSVTVTLSYSGGCRDHEFKLRFDDDCTGAELCRTTLLHVKGADDPCEALIEEDVTLSLSGLGVRPRKLQVLNRHGQGATIHLQ